MIHFETYNIDGEKRVWDFDTVQEIADNYWSDDCTLPSNDDEVICAYKDGEEIKCDDFLDLIHALDIDVYICVEFEEHDGSIYSMVIKAARYPTIDELKTFLAKDMQHFGYADIYNYYIVDEEEVYVGYDTENIDNWPIFGA